MKTRKSGSHDKERAVFHSALSSKESCEKVFMVWRQNVELL